MSNYESEVERHAGVDMVPFGESFEWNPGPDDGAPIPRPDFNFNVPNPVGALSQYTRHSATLPSSARHTDSGLREPCV